MRLLILCCSVLVMTGCGHTIQDDGTDTVPMPSVTKQEAAAFIAANNTLAATLYPAVKESSPANFLYSPTSMATALALVYPGARGQTAEEIAKLLAVSLPRERLIEAGRWFRHELAGRQREGIEVKLANAVWGQEDKPWRPEYLEILKNKYGAELHKADFLNHSEQARQLINQWAAQKTGGKIQGYLPVGMINQSTVMVLANALYFKGNWSQAFRESDTFSQKFYREPERALDVPMMHASKNYPCKEAPGVQILEIPYKGDELGFVIVLPQKKDGLAELEKDLTPVRLAGWLENLGTTEDIVVSFPKIKMSTNLDLKTLLTRLGMTSAFSAKDADFSGMGGAPGDLFLENSMQKTHLEVNEKGTEAVAVTHASGAKSEARKSKQFVADHPFLFLIRDRTHNTVLFMGRVADPSR